MVWGGGGRAARPPTAGRRGRGEGPRRPRAPPPPTAGGRARPRPRRPPRAPRARPGGAPAPAGLPGGGRDARRSWGDPREGPGSRPESPPPPAPRVPGPPRGGPPPPPGPRRGSRPRPPAASRRAPPPTPAPRPRGGGWWGGGREGREESGRRGGREPAAGWGGDGPAGAGPGVGGRRRLVQPRRAPSPASRPSPTDPALRANPYPEVTDPACRLPLPTLFQHARGCSPWRPAADMGTARREIYTLSPGFSRASESSPDAAGTATLSKARAPLSGRTHSRAPCPSQRKENSPRGSRRLLRDRLRYRTGRLAAPVSATPDSGI